MLAPPSPARAAGCGRVQVGGERSAVTPGAAQGLLPPAGCQRRRAEGSVLRGSVRLPAAGARAVLFLIGNPPLPRGQHVIEGVPADTGPGGGGEQRSRTSPHSPAPEPGQPTAHTHLMDLIHSSFSSGLGAEMRYTTWLPSTTRPSASVLQALMTCPLWLGL